MKQSWFVYAILCSNDSVYIGQTKDLAVRWEQHSKGKGAEWTKKYPPITMFYHEKLGSYLKSVRRERELKTSTYRKKLKKLLLTGECPEGLKLPRSIPAVTLL